MKLLLMLCDRKCSVSHPHGAVGWSSVWRFLVIFTYSFLRNLWNVIYFRSTELNAIKLKFYTGPMAWGHKTCINCSRNIIKICHTQSATCIKGMFAPAPPVYEAKTAFHQIILISLFEQHTFAMVAIIAAKIGWKKNWPFLNNFETFDWEINKDYKRIQKKDILTDDSIITVHGVLKGLFYI